MTPIALVRRGHFPFADSAKGKRMSRYCGDSLTAVMKRVR